MVFLEGVVIADGTSRGVGAVEKRSPVKKFPSGVALEECGGGNALAVVGPSHLEPLEKASAALDMLALPILAFRSSSNCLRC